MIHVSGKKGAEVLHVDGMCNECGNCAIFCPYNGAPYKDKFTLFWSEEDFKNSKNNGFAVLGDDSFLLRLDGKEEKLNHAGIEKISKDAAGIVKAVLKDYRFLI